MAAQTPGSTQQEVIAPSPAHRGPRFFSSAVEKLSAVGLAGLSSPGTPRSDWAAGANAARCFAGCDAGSATGTRLRKVSPGTGCCSGHLQLAGGRERAEVRAQLFRSACLLLRLRLSTPVVANESQEKNTPRGGSQRSFSPDCRVGATPRAKLIAAAAQTRQVNPSQQNAQWHHKPGTRGQFSSLPTPLFNHQWRTFAISLKNQTASSECSFSFKDSSL